MNIDEVRWGIIGAGDVCEVKSGPAFQQISHSRLVAVMRRDAEKAQDFAQRHRVPKWYTNATELIQDPDINAIYIATPPDSHASYTIEALQQGKPVYVEKPMARTYEECEKMLRVARETNIPLFVAYYRRYLPYFLNVKDWINRGQIGDIRLVNIKLYRSPKQTDFDPIRHNWRIKPEISGGGYFVDLGAHQIDLLDFVLGKIRTVNSHVSNQGGLYEAEDIVSASFYFESGIIGTGIWCFTADEGQEKDEIEIVGSKGRITFPCFRLAPLHMENEQGIHEKIISHPKHIQQPLIEHIVRYLRGKGSLPTTGEVSARTNHIMSEILKAYYKP